MRRTELQALFRREGLRPRRSLGQNFLTDPNLLDFVVRQAEVSRDDVILEVGTGTGGLARPLARAAHRLVTVEVDPAVAHLARVHLRDLTNVEMLLLDVLASKDSLAPEVRAALDRSLAERPGLRLKLVANLPFSIATPLIMVLLESGLAFERMVATVQHEVALRFTADSGSRDYGVPTVLACSLATVSLLRVIPPQVFWPMPKVQSAILRIDPLPGGTAAIASYARLRDAARMLLHFRRKSLGRALRESGLVPDAAAARVVASSVGLDPAIRPDQVPVEKFQALAVALDTLASSCAPGT